LTDIGCLSLSIERLIFKDYVLKTEKIIPEAGLTGINSKLFPFF